MRVTSGLAILGAIGGLATPIAQAQWTGKGEIGALVSRGNSDATSANVKLDVAHERARWKNSLFVGGLYGRNSTFTTAQRIEGRGQTEHEVGDHAFWFLALRGEQDRFSGFQYQATASAGLGYKFIDNNSTKLTGSLGAGYRRLRPEELIRSAAGEVLNRIPGDPVGDAVASAGIDYSHQLTQTTRLLDKLLVESGVNNTTVQNDFALQVNMTQRIALSVGYGVRYNADPPQGAKSTDQLTTINLVYSVK